MKKLLLMFPNQSWFKRDLATSHNVPPTSLCQLAAMVRDLVKVRIVDCHFEDWSQERFREYIATERPDYVGISVLTTEYGSTLDVTAAMVKAVDPAIVTIAGGVHATTRSEQVMRNPDVDYLCRGEGEELLRELLLFLAGAGPRPASGLGYREDGRVVIQDRRVVEDINILPRPAYDLVDLPRYLNTDARYGPTRFPRLPGFSLVASRGCPYDCSFCQVDMIAGRKVRALEPLRIADELGFLIERYGIRSVVFQDDNLFALKKVAKPLMREMIRREMNLQWICPSFALFVMDDEMLDLMQASGCVGVNVAIESGSPRVLKDIVRKPIKDLNRVPELIARLKARDIWVLANFIVGFPGETWEEIRQTIHFAEHCGADYVKLFFAVPLAGTKLYDMARAMNALDVHEDDLKVNWRHSQLRSEEWTPQDLSILRVYEWDRINFAPDRIDRVAKIWGMSREQLQEVRRQTRESLVF
ncbi:MAG: radical SAM protein [Magnetococcales bacterium]|nr:radical SAM protein [Magnetococcales bacterium]